MNTGVFGSNIYFIFNLVTYLEFNDEIEKLI